MRALLFLLTALTCCAAPIGFNNPAPSLGYGLVGWWTMNEGVGTNANDYSGNNNVGTLTNSPIWTNGIISGALYFNGQNANKMGVITTYAGTLTNFSAAAWFKATGSGYGTYERIIEKDYRTGFVICRVGTTAGAWAGYCIDPGVARPTYNTLTDGVWHHIVMVRNGSNWTAYGEGGLYSSTTTNCPTTALDSTTLKIGQSTAALGWSLFYGFIDDVRIYNRALSTAEVKQLYNGGYGAQ